MSGVPWGGGCSHTAGQKPRHQGGSRQKGCAQCGCRSGATDWTLGLGGRVVGAIQVEHRETGNLDVAVKERFSLTSREDITEGRICK